MTKLLGEEKMAQADPDAIAMLDALITKQSRRW